jgi:hypothetical protein
MSDDVPTTETTTVDPALRARLSALLAEFMRTGIVAEQTKRGTSARVFANAAHHRAERAWKAAWFGLTDAQRETLVARPLEGAAGGPT